MTNFVLGFGMNVLMTHLPCLTLLMSFLRYPNSRHNSIKFTNEFEQDNVFRFRHPCQTLPDNIFS